MTTTSGPTARGGDQPERASSAKPMRKDVARNRALLLTTADRLISERGPDITFHDLAAAAGVGVGTVYRHFADTDELLEALIGRRFDDIGAALAAAEALDDPADALRAAVMNVCELQQQDRAIWHAMLSESERHRGLSEKWLLPTLTRIVDRAVAAGVVHPDIAPTDLAVITWLGGSLVRFGAPVRAQLWRRYIAAMLDGLMVEPDARRPSSEPPLTVAEFGRVDSAVHR